MPDRWRIVDTLGYEERWWDPYNRNVLKADKPVDLFHLVGRYTWLARLVDTEYGSASFIEVRRPARFEVRVSTTGLLLRESEFRQGAR
jgi:hypothetical protein